MMWCIYYIFLIFLLCSLNEGIKTEVEWTKTLVMKIFILNKGQNFSLFFYTYDHNNVLNLFVFLDKEDSISLRKFIRLICEQSLEIKILSNISIDFSFIYDLTALITSYTIIMYQMIDSK